MAEDDHNLILAAAYAYAEVGLAVTPLKGKRPILPAWGEKPLEREALPGKFGADSNIGIVLGHLSKLADIDFDCDEAARQGSSIFPATSAVFGRKSRPQSHRLYRVIDPGPRVTFEDPMMKATPRTDRGTAVSSMIVEYRGDGCQTMVPPSLHPTPGEGRLVWVEENPDPALATRQELLMCCAKLAIAVMRLRYSAEQLEANAGARTKMEEWASLAEGRAHEATGAESNPPPSFADHRAVATPRHTVSGVRGPSEEKVHRRLNDHALGQLSSWVPHLLLPRCISASGGYRAVAHWRSSNRGRPLYEREPNLSIHPQGIVDFGASQKYTPLDLIMAALNLDLFEAFHWLKEKTTFPGSWPANSSFIEARAENIQSLPSTCGRSDIVVIATTVEEAEAVATATGYEVKVSTDSGWVRPVPGKRNVYLLDDYVMSHPKRRRAWKAARDSWRNQPLNLIDVGPYPGHGHGKSFVDLLAKRGAAAVKEQDRHSRIPPADYAAASRTFKHRA